MHVWHLLGMGVGLMSPDCEHGIQQQHTLVAPLQASTGFVDAALGFQMQPKIVPGLAGKEEQWRGEGRLDLVSFFATHLGSVDEDCCQSLSCLSRFSLNRGLKTFQRHGQELQR